MSQAAEALRVLIVDDEPPARARLRSLLDDLSRDLPVQIAGEASDGRSAVSAVQSGAADIVLLDIQMPGPSGLEVAKSLAGLPRAPELIFVTAFDDFAVQAFDLEATDYLTKPVRTDRLRTAIERAARRIESRRLPAPANDDEGPLVRTHLPVHERGRVVLVPIDEVVYFKAEMKYVTIRTREREYLTEESLVSLESEFMARVVRIHRNALIARDSILGFERVPAPAGESGGEAHWEVLLRGVPERLAVSRRQWAQVRELARSTNG